MGKIAYLREYVLRDLEKSVQNRDRDAESSKPETPEQVKALENYKRITEDRRKNMQIIKDVCEGAVPVQAVAEMALKYSHALMMFEKDKEDMQGVLSFSAEIIKDVEEFIADSKKISIFGAEGFNLEAKSIQMKSFKTIIDKLWNSLPTNNS